MTYERKLVAFLVFHLLQFSDGKECKYNRQGYSSDHQIREDILCGYENRIRPVTNQSIPTHVTNSIYLQSIDLKNNVFTLNAWFYWNWDDHFLKWDLKKYDWTDHIIVNNYHIWVPDIVLYSDIDKDISGSIRFTRCKVLNNGLVTCVIPMQFKSRCTPDIYNWPFDSQRCRLELGSWFYSNLQIALFFQKNPIFQLQFIQNNEWFLSNKNYSKITINLNNKLQDRLIYEFELTRHGAVHIYTIIVPALALAIFTLSSLWVDIKSPSRCIVCLTSLMSHLIFLIYLASIEPHNGDKCPKIVVYFKDSLILSAINLFYTIFSKNLPYIWANYTGFLKWIFLFQFIKTQSETTSSATSLQNSSQQEENRSREFIDKWMEINIILDRLIFILFFFIYILFSILFFIF